MQKQMIYKFFIPIAFLASIFSGPVYNLLVFLNTSILESHWSIYLDPIVFANVLAISFILFAVIFLISIKYIEKVLKEPLIILAIIVIGFCSIFVGLTWVFDIIFLSYIISGSAFAYLIPTLAKYTTDKIQNVSEDNRIKLVFPVSSLIWIIISFALFFTFGASWRFLYFVFGTINIISSFAFLII